MNTGAEQIQKLKILLVSAEVVPFAKTGGLADVAGSLPKALALMGHDVRIVMPKYRMIKQPATTLVDFPVEVGGRKETAIIRQTHIEAFKGDEVKKVPVYLVDNYHFFDREGIYCHHDEDKRFGFFSKAVLEMLPQIDFKPDLIHCNDWQSGPIPLMLKDVYRNHPFYANIATLFTVHNLLYQGNWNKDILEFLGINEKYFNSEGVEFYGQVSFIKTGLVYADIINTVSNTYAQEIQTPEYGEKLEGLLRKRRDSLYGIINGLDYQEFNPSIDPHIYRQYSLENLNDKKANKEALQKELGLPQRDVPLLGLVSRLVDQKGLDLIEEITDDLLKEDIQLVVLGSGDAKYEDLFTELQQKNPDKVGAHIGFNAPLAQRIYAGSDMFLMPSRFEPCGLGQLISLKYGTIPLVRATGGLADTIKEFEVNFNTGNGFVFTEYKGSELLKTVDRAIEVYNKPQLWQVLIRNAMEADFSWDRSAHEYVKLYRLGMKKRAD